MSATGIGAAVRRKEDQRFITGKGHYTDDINRPGQAPRLFRALAARPRQDQEHRRQGGGRDARRARGAHRRRACRRQDRQSHLRLDDPFQGRLADEDGAASGDRARQGLLCRRSGRGRDRRDAGAGQGRRREGQGRLRGAAGGRRSGQGARQRRAADPRGCAAATRSISGTSATPKAADAAFKSAKHVTKLDIVNNRLVPNAIEPRAAIGEYDAGTDSFTLWNTTQNPHVARLVIAAFVGMAPEHKLRVIAPDVGGGFGSKIFIYPEEVVCLWASQEGRPAGEMGLRPLRSVPGRCARPRPRHPRRDGVRRRRQDHRAARSRPSPISAPTCRPSRRRCRPISTRTLLSGQYDIPAIYCEVDAVYTNTVPVDAYRGAGRPEATFVVERLVEVGARELGVDPADLRKKNFIKTFPHQTPVIMTYDAGDYHASLKKALEIADYKGFGKRKRESARARQAARHRLFDLYRGLRHRAVARRSARSARASACGNPPRCGSIRPARSRSSPAAISTARATRRPSRRSFPSGSASRSTTSASCTATPTRCSSAWAPTARARARSACRRS